MSRNLEILLPFSPIYWRLAFLSLGAALGVEASGPTAEFKCTDGSQKIVTTEGHYESWFCQDQATKRWDGPYRYVHQRLKRTEIFGEYVQGKKNGSWIGINPTSPQTQLIQSFSVDKPVGQWEFRRSDKVIGVLNFEQIKDRATFQNPSSTKPAWLPVWDIRTKKNYIGFVEDLSDVVKENEDQAYKKLIEAANVYLEDNGVPFLSRLPDSVPVYRVEPGPMGWMAMIPGPKKTILDVRAFQLGGCRGFGYVFSTAGFFGDRIKVMLDDDSEMGGLPELRKVMVQWKERLRDTDQVRITKREILIPHDYFTTTKLPHLESLSLFGLDRLAGTVDQGRSLIFRIPLNPSKTQGWWKKLNKKRPNLRVGHLPPHLPLRVGEADIVFDGRVGSLNWQDWEIPKGAVGNVRNYSKHQVRLKFEAWNPVCPL